jgi:hypothetical protein
MPASTNQASDFECTVCQTRTPLDDRFDQSWLTDKNPAGGSANLESGYIPVCGHCYFLTNPCYDVRSGLRSVREAAEVADAAWTRWSAETGARDVPPPNVPSKQPPIPHPDAGNVIFPPGPR